VVAAGLVIARTGARERESRATHRLGDGIMDNSAMMGKLRTKDAAGKVVVHRS
jgi:hypothetical protein